MWKHKNARSVCLCRLFSIDGIYSGTIKTVMEARIRWTSNKIRKRSINRDENNVEVKIAFRKVLGVRNLS
jgi:hypothetical protein